MRDVMITANGSGVRLQRASGTDHLTRSINNTSALPNHHNDGSRGDEVNEALEELLALVLSIVLLSNGSLGQSELHAHKGEALLLEAADDLANLESKETKKTERVRNPDHTQNKVCILSHAGRLNEKN
jgi:hypothetical protein